MWLPLTHPLSGTWPATQACAVTESKQQLFGSQAGAQPTEPHQPGPFFTFLKSEFLPNDIWVFPKCQLHLHRLEIFHFLEYLKLIVYTIFSALTVCQVLF